MKLFSVIVTYHPTAQVLERLTETLLAVGVQVIVVDNTPGGFTTPAGCTGISMGGNAGIAKAQNEGVQRALAAGAEAILFFDQDSTIHDRLVADLTKHLDVTRPGVIGPLHFDERQGFECPNYVLNRWGYPRQVVSAGRRAPYPVDSRISSGSLITAPTFATAGPFDEALFLDYVDIEWCLRARARQVPILINPSVEMRHTIGDKAVQTGPLKVFIDGPVRSYYRMRNALLLLRRREVPILFAFKEIAAEVVHQTLQLVIADQRAARFGALISGFWHGVIGLGGRYRE
ncbi:glycosyltransferase family 2 protein [Rubrivivax gelatinosus]|uniref:glycosyltransferase family 2 protein n=1 Tax=Rubrivivax gelatinosus TaxID=28068 RepID=UPI0005C130C2|nr:glycosyltransferase family 2 protein [Rubrivivax gelatinosus]MBG6079398.1 rhamnosyltransferase [Rubrivivax gelatinosus]